jgi:hypothetical protein
MDSGNNTLDFKELLPMYYLIYVINEPTRVTTTSAKIINHVIIMEFFKQDIYKSIVQEIFVSDHKAEIVEFKYQNYSKCKIKHWLRSYSDRNVEKFMKILQDEN